MTDEILSTSAPSPLAPSPSAPVPADAEAPAIPAHLQWLTVESLDLEAQGVAHRPDGKVVFIEDALPGEEVRVSVTRRTTGNRPP